MFGMLGVFLAVGIVGIVEGMLTGPPGKSLGYVFGFGIGSALSVALPLTALLLLLSGVYYLTARKGGTTFREALFNWPMVCVATLSLVFYLAA